MTVPLPRIEPMKCTGCGRCVEVCPVGALVQARGQASLRSPNRCTYCAACQDCCPQDAIALPWLIVFAGRKS